MIWLELLVLLLLAGLSIFLASVEASFHLLKRRRLAQVTRHDEAIISKMSSRVKIMIIPTNEERMIAIHTARVLKETPARA